MAGRGRPWRPAGSTGATDGGSDGSHGSGTGIRARIGWLLRVNRLYGPQEQWTRAGTFAAAFGGGSHPQPVSTSKISRWENGLVPVPRTAVSRYEELLALEPGSLLSTVDVTIRNMSAAPLPTGSGPGAAAARGGTPHADQRLEALLERLDSTDTLTARMWDEATAWIAAEPGLRLRRGEWETICHRLLVETVAADGEAWKPRFEGLNRLLNHPGSRRSAIAVCAAWAASPDSRVFIETISLLDASPHPDAARHVVAQLRAPTNSDAFTGALLACVRKLRDHHFSPPQREQVTDAVLGVLADPARAQDPVYPLAVAALRLLPADATRRLSGRLRLPGAPPPGHAGADGPAAGQDTRGGRLHPLIAARSTAMLPRENPHFQDLLLPVVVGELLDSPVFDDRLYAGFLLRATPYRAPVADTLVWELGRQRPAQSTAWTTRLLEALRIVGTPEERPYVEALATRRGLPVSVQTAAVQALGHMGGSSGTEVWRTLVARHTAAALGGGPGSQDLLHHAVYSLAIGRHTDELRRIATVHPLPPVRTSARWWLRLPTHMYLSAGQ
ncbi:XRE family transcriptional regulator [Streptomyces sp. NPDC051976]|uniref:XRE family transcriptional regulator n=1 Tax=Streptomyces sp. NPDC051976 TaxID=3154947 RepID=UPI0034262550